MTKLLTLTTVPKGPTTEPNKKKREQIVNIETPPNPDWFVSTREYGWPVWYLRFRMTGMFSRRFDRFRTVTGLCWRSMR